MLTLLVAGGFPFLVGLADPASAAKCKRKSGGSTTRTLLRDEERVRVARLGDGKILVEQTQGKGWIKNRDCDPGGGSFGDINFYPNWFPATLLLSIDGSSADDAIHIGAGRSNNSCRGEMDLDGDGDSDDKVVGGPGDDDIFGYNGEDKLEGNGGQDLLRGGSKADEIFPGPGNDSVLAGPGDDTTEPSPGEDTVWGGRGRDNDTVFGGEGNDTFDAGCEPNGADTSSRGQGLDLLDHSCRGTAHVRMTGTRPPSSSTTTSRRARAGST